MNQNEKRKALGRGLDSLLPAARGTAPAMEPGETIRDIQVGLIDRNPYQARKRFDESAMRELAASIRSSGVVQPVLLRPSTGGRYQLVAGERRWLGSQMAGKNTVPAVIRKLSNEQSMEIAIVENLQREDLNAMEQAHAYERLGREFGMTQEQIAQRTGKDRSSVSNFLRLLKLPEEVQTLIEEGKLSFGHAKALMSLDSPKAAVKLAKRTIAKSFSVRQLEGTVQGLMHPGGKPAKPERKVDPNVREAERAIARSLGMRVRIEDRGGKGRLIIEYGSLEDYDRLVVALEKLK